MYLWCALYLVALYALQFTVVAPVVCEGVFLSLGLFAGLTLSILLLTAVGIGLAIAGAVRAVGNERLTRRLTRTALALKLLTIPFFLLHLSSWTLLSAAFLVIPGLQIFLLSVFVAVAFAYGVLLTSSAYSLAALYWAHRAGRLGQKGLVWAIVSQFIFVADVIGYVAVLLWPVKARSKEVV